MTEHQGLPVAGYQSQSDQKVQAVNANKLLEERCVRACEWARDKMGADPRMTAIAVTGIQEAFMWLNRSIFQPSRVALPGDKDEDVL